MQDIRGPWRAEDGPLDAPVFEVAAVDLVGAEPLFDPLLDAVALGEAHGARSRGEAVIHEVHRVLKRGERETAGGGERKVTGRQRGETTEQKYCHQDFKKSKTFVIVEKSYLKN